MRPEVYQNVDIQSPYIDCFVPSWTPSQDVTSTVNPFAHLLITISQLLIDSPDSRHPYHDDSLPEQPNDRFTHNPRPRIVQRTLDVAIVLKHFF